MAPLSFIPALVWFFLPALVSVALASRRVGDRSLLRFALRHDLTYTPENLALVSAHLRRARLLRTAGGWLGVLLPLLLAQLSGGRVLIGGYPYVLLGYVVGAVVAEAVYPRPWPQGPRRAELAPRRVTSYLPRWAVVTRWALVPASGALLVWQGAWSLAARGEPLWGTFAAVAGCAIVAVGAELLLRAVVRRRRPLSGADMGAADDAVRTSSLRVLTAASLAIQLLLISTQLAAIGRLARAGGVNGTAADLLHFLPILLAVACWSALRRPAVHIMPAAA